ncbi:MAG: hypothetical protein WCY70_06160 [Methanoculleus sp.]
MFLYYFWVAVIIAIQFTFFTETNAMGVSVVMIPLMPRAWLVAGLLPFFLILGHYLFREKLPVDELLLNRSGLAASASGFLLWLLVLAVLEVLGITVEYHYYVAGGYVVMLIFGMILWKTWSRGA